MFTSFFLLPLALVSFVFCLTPKSIAEEPIDIAKTIQFPVEKFQLENGMTFIVQEDHSLPIISYNQWFRVGSRDEKPGKTGLAHFFEHLMFKGTSKYPGKDFDRMLQSKGGSNNAFTSHDYTGYYINLPSSQLELAMDIESDRMRNLLFDPKEIQSEREVVKEERRYRVENNVYGMLEEALYKTVFKVHPYRWPVVGYMKDLNAASLDDMKEFYNVFYAPNNAVVVVAGDVSVSQVKSLAKKYYGKIKAQKLPEKKFAQEPAQKGQRSVFLTKDLQSPVFAVAFQGPSILNEDSYAMDLLSNILGTGPSSRLHRRLVYRNQLATSVGVESYTPADIGVFNIVVTMKSGSDMDKTLNILYSELYKARMELVSEEELEKAKNQVVSAYVNRLKTSTKRAYLLAWSEILFGDYNRVFRDVGRYLGVTREEIKAVADKYLKPEQRNVIRVQPTPQQGAGA